MKSFLIIGMGELGHHLYKELLRAGCEVMIADKDAGRLDDVIADAVSAKVCDCTKIEVLKTFGVEDFSGCFVCVGDNFQDCLEITDLLKELGARQVYSAASRDVEEKFLLRCGADRVIYPERDVARRIAGIVSSESIFDYINLSDDYAIYEIDVLDKWIGKTVKELDFRNRYNLNIVAFKTGETVLPMFRNDYVFKEDEHILVLGHPSDVRKVLK